MKNYFIKKGKDNLWHLYTKEGEEIAFAQRREDLEKIKRDKEQNNDSLLLPKMLGYGRPI